MTSTDLQRITEWEDRISASVAACGTPWKIRCYEETGSTMDCARDLLKEPGGERAMLALARRQTQGRGQHGRKWESTPGGFSGTYLFTTERPTQAMAGFSLVVGIVITDICKALGIGTFLKWPNDIFSQDGRKMGGILVELVPHHEGLALLAGIGINLTNDPTQISQATSLQAQGASASDPVFFAEHLSPQLYRAWREFERSGFEPFMKSWNDRALFIGKSVAIESGGQIVGGICRGVDANGFLLIDQPSGVRVVASGLGLRTNG